MRRLLLLVAGVIVTALVLTAAGYREARRDPIVQTARIALPDWPAGAAPVRVLLASDVHLGSVVMDEARLERVVAQIDALQPDLIVLAGDFIDGHEPGSAQHQAGALQRAVRRLRAPFGTVAVLGNHDHWTNAAAVIRALQAGGVTVLVNEVTQRGLLAIGGVDDDYTGHARLGPTLAKLRGLSGARVMISHSPDVAPRLSAEVPLLLSGHTHCGQIVLPLIGGPGTPSRYGERYRCGLIREGGRLTVVTAGLGTSVIPLRFGAPPDLWLLTLGPSPQRP